MADAPRPKRRVFDASFVVLIAVTLASAAGVIWTEGGGRALEITRETTLFLLELGPKLTAGVFITATLPVLIPRERIGQWIGADSGLRGLFLASVAGPLVPGGPSMAFALAGGFLAAGADLGAVVAFGTGWSLISLNRTLIWEFSFLPPHLVALRIFISLPFPILCGWAARRVAARRRPA